MGKVDEIERAVRVLRSGGLVAFPTETVYGLGADAENARAVQRIFAAKGRPPNHPLIVHIGATAELADWAAAVPEPARLLAERFWPGPLTLVLRRSFRVPLAVTGGLDTVALRVPDHPLALALLRAFGGAIAAPSANRFGAVSPTTAWHVREDLGEAVDHVLDGGPCEIGLESTIIDVGGDEPVILRPGGVPREEIERVLRRPVPTEQGGGPVRSPGQHPSHYAPRAEVVLVEVGDIVECVRRLYGQGVRVGVMLPARTSENLSQELPAGVVALRLPESTTDYARQLYESLRELDRRGCEVIIASPPPEEGLGLAIADRLRHAAGPRVPAHPDQTREGPPRRLTERGDQ